MDPEVRRAVMRRPPWHGVVQARLVGYEALYVKGKVYPALARRPGGRQEGFLLPLPDPVSLNALDEHEGPEYRRGLIWVSVGGRLRRAACYLTAPGTPLTRNHWRLDARWRRGRPRYLRRYALSSSRMTAWPQITRPLAAS